MLRDPNAITNAAGGRTGEVASDETLTYQKRATTTTPALVVFLIDVSASTGIEYGERRRIDAIQDVLKRKLMQMLYRCVVGAEIRNRFQVAAYSYSEQVEDLLGGVKTIEQATNQDLPDLTPRFTSDARPAFLAAEELLKKLLPGMKDSPAPLVCHITDGLMTGSSIIDAVRRIQNLSVPDGHVLVEHILVGHSLGNKANQEEYTWSGIQKQDILKDEMLKLYQSVASQLPHTYREACNYSGYDLKSNTVMVWPEACPGLYEATLPYTITS